MEFFPLTIFPEGGLVSSVITTVWVGVFVLCFFNLRFGWVLSGLVVPGYLVPLLIVKPVSAAVITVEAILTYLIVWLFSEKLAPGRYPSLFGRDRFLGLILASIAVRLSMDGFILPEFADWLEQNFDRRFDWQSNLQSFGLVIISLLANQFWKPGLARGLVAAAVTTGITCLIVRYGLMEFTNFRLSGVSYMYEGLASSMLASPKAYIILTLTAMIASHMNVRYGWDFSGILIPALIALQWYQPTKILTSFGEAIAIYAIARLILMLPFMANVTMEGGRKLLLFFNISFAWKLGLGWFVVTQGIEIKTTDFYGFGYLLSTLIAIKAHDKDIFPRLARSTLQVSLAGAVLGNIAGFALSATVTRNPFTTLPPSVDQAAKDTQLNGLLVTAIGHAHVRAVRGESKPLSDKSAMALSDLVELVEKGGIEFSDQFDQSADGWRVQSVGAGRLAIIRDDGQGHELLLFDSAAQRDLAVVVPDPTEASGLGFAALSMHSGQGASWLVVGAPNPVATLEGADFVSVFANASQHDQLRLRRAPDGVESSTAFFANEAAKTTDIAALRSTIPGIEIELRGGLPDSGVDRAVLQLTDSALQDLAVSVIGDHRPSSSRCPIPRPARAEKRWRDLNQLAFIRYELAEDFLGSAIAGEYPARAKTAAALAGFTLRHCQIGGRAHWALYANSRNEGHFFIADGENPANVLISYRDERRLLPARIGEALHSQWGSDALLVMPQADSYSRRSDTAFDVIWQELVRRQPLDQETTVFQLLARPGYVPNQNRYVDVVLAPDRIGTDPQLLNNLASITRAAGLRPAIATGGREQAGLEARPVMSVRYFNETSGRRYVFGWLMLPGRRSE